MLLSSMPATPRFVNSKLLSFCHGDYIVGLTNLSLAAAHPCGGQADPDRDSGPHVCCQLALCS